MSFITSALPAFTSASSTSSLNMPRIPLVISQLRRTRPRMRLSLIYGRVRRSILFRSVVSAPFSSSNFTVSARPRKAAACSAVPPSRLLAFTSASCSKRSATTAAYSPTNEIIAYLWASTPQIVYHQIVDLSYSDLLHLLMPVSSLRYHR